MQRPFLRRLCAVAARRIQRIVRIEATLCGRAVCLHGHAVAVHNSTLSCDFSIISWLRSTKLIYVIVKVANKKNSLNHIIRHRKIVIIFISHSIKGNKARPTIPACILCAGNNRAIFLNRNLCFNVDAFPIIVCFCINIPFKLYNIRDDNFTNSCPDKITLVWLFFSFGIKSNSRHIMGLPLKDFCFECISV